MPKNSISNLRGGVWTALVTPFLKNGNVDYGALTKLIQRQIDAGVHALVPCGTTGEAATLSGQEKAEIVKLCVQMCRDKNISVIAGAGHNDTKEAVLTHLLMKEAGAHATLHVTPYYNKPSQEGLYLHFKAIAEACELPVVLYNNPGRTALDMSPATTARLVKDFSNIVGIKETSFDCARVQVMIQQLKAINPEFLFLAGEDALVFSNLTMGGDGVISTSSNFAPEIFVDLLKSVVADDLVRARSCFGKISKLAPLMFMTTNPLPVKTALSFLGLLETNFRLPLCAMSHEEEEHLKIHLIKLGFL